MKFSDQMVEALHTCHPDARREIPRALNDLATGLPRDTIQLENNLVGLFRLRVGRFRVICRLGESREVIAEYLAPRKDLICSFKIMP
jgi:mRNA-degrading endonuclease RelE of RelBE toxin-antitoxin system